MGKRKNSPVSPENKNTLFQWTDNNIWGTVLGTALEMCVSVSG